VTDSRSGTSQKRPWLAAALAVLVPGVGHVYIRMWGRALGWFGLYFLATQFLVPETARPESLSLSALSDAAGAVPAGVTLLLTAITALNVVDAYLATRRHNRRRRPSSAAPTCPECGREVDGDLEFCHWCTASLEQDTPDTAE